jgi:hypothetical protein
VRSVVATPDSADIAQDATSDLISTWGPRWVSPVCDEAGFARRTVMMADAPTRLRVVVSDEPGDVPQLVYPDSGAVHIDAVDPWWPFKDWDKGIALSPEEAVAVAATRLEPSMARVSEVPEAFTVVVPPGGRRGPPGSPVFHQSMSQPHACPRWRLTLDRVVTLRGLASGQVVTTRTVYVARGDNGCGGTPTLQIPRPTQPVTLPFSFGVRRGSITIRSPQRGLRPSDLPPIEFRVVALRVIEPVWFEEARLAAARP